MYSTQLLIHVYRSTKKVLKIPQMTLKGFEIMKAHMNSSEKVLQTISNFEKKKLDTNDGCGLSWLVLKDRVTKIAEKVLPSDLFHKF